MNHLSSLLQLLKVCKIKFSEQDIIERNIPNVIKSKKGYFEFGSQLELLKAENIRKNACKMIVLDSH